MIDNMFVELALSDLKGIADDMVKHATRSISKALMRGQRPGTLGRRIFKVGEKTTPALNGFCNSFIVNLNNQGRLDVFAARGIKMVGVRPEHVAVARDAITDRKEPATVPVTRLRRRMVGLLNIETAGDDKVCPRCEDLEEDGPYTLQQARRLLPAHPNCRCAFVLYIAARFIARVA